MTIQAYLSLGANKYNRSEQIERALELLPLKGVTVVKVSSMYDTDPVGHSEQARFLNCVAEVETELDGKELLRVLKSIEKELGREVSERWGPREIDIDILFHGDTVLDTEELTIPHCELQRRKFVLVPLCELNGEIIHPVFNKTVRELLRECGDSSEVIRVES